MLSPQRNTRIILTTIRFSFSSLVVCNSTETTLVSYILDDVEKLGIILSNKNQPPSLLQPNQVTSHLFLIVMFHLFIFFFSFCYEIKIEICCSFLYGALYTYLVSFGRGVYMVSRCNAIIVVYDALLDITMKVIVELWASPDDIYRYRHRERKVILNL